MNEKERLDKIYEKLTSITAFVLEGENLASEFGPLGANAIALELLSTIKTIEAIQHNFIEKLYPEKI